MCAHNTPPSLLIQIHTHTYSHSQMKAAAVQSPKCLNLSENLGLVRTKGLTHLPNHSELYKCVLCVLYRPCSPELCFKPRVVLSEIAD